MSKVGRVVLPGRNLIAKIVPAGMDCATMANWGSTFRVGGKGVWLHPLWHVQLLPGASSFPYHGAWGAGLARCGLVCTWLHAACLLWPGRRLGGGCVASVVGWVSWSPRPAAACCRVAGAWSCGSWVLCPAAGLVGGCFGVWSSRCGAGCCWEAALRWCPGEFPARVVHSFVVSGYSDPLQLPAVVVFGAGRCVLTSAVVVYVARWSCRLWVAVVWRVFLLRVLVVAVVVGFPDRCSGGSSRRECPD